MENNKDIEKTNCNNRNDIGNSIAAQAIETSQFKGNLSKFIEGRDYYYNEKNVMIMAVVYHLKMGICCRNNCLHCPWSYQNNKE